METILEPTCKPRNYQLEILYTALNENTLAFLPTGAGKTLISVLYMKHRLNMIKGKNESGGMKKIIVFIAPTKILVQQQKRYISAYSDACVKAYTVETKYPGEKIISQWDKSAWKYEIFAIDIMVKQVSNPEIVKQILHGNYLPIESFDSVILDGCHHAFGKHPMAGICEIIGRKRFYRPRMLGMTASPLPCKKGSIAAIVHQLESITGFRLVAPKDTILELREAVPIPTFNILRYADVELRWLFRCNDDEEYPLPVSTFKDAASPLPLPTSQSPVALRIRTDALKVMSHAYDRLKFADYVSDIQLLLTTLNMKSSEMPELSGLVLWDNVPPPSTLSTGEDAAATNSHFAKACLTDLRQAMGQILGVLEDCGLICAINALISVLDTYSFAPVQTLRNSDRVLAMKNELLESAFEAIDLADYEFVVHSSLLEIFAALSSGLGSEKCLRAASEIRTLIRQSREEKRRNDELVQQIALDISRGNDMNEPISSDSGSNDNNIGNRDSSPQSSGVDVLVDASNSDGEARMKVETAKQKERASSSPSPIPTPTDVPLSPLASTSPDSKYYTTFGEVDMAVQAVHDILYVLGGNKDPLVEVGSLGIARLLYKRLEGKEGFPSFQRIRSVIQTSCMVMLNTFSLGELSSLLVYNSSDTMLVLEPLIFPSDEPGALAMPPTTPPPPQTDTLTTTTTSEIPLISRKAKALLFYLLRHSPIALERTLAFAKAFNSTHGAAPGKREKGLGQIGNKYDLREAVFDLPDNWASIVFCKMRLTAKALCTLLTSVQQEADAEGSINPDTLVTLFSNTCSISDNNNNIRGIHSLRPIFITGEKKEKEQDLALTDFRNGKYNILFVTDVAEEGLDVRACHLVVNYDLPNTVKSFIQRRGRARAVNSQIIAIIPLGVKGNDLLSEFIRFTVQEKETHGQRGAGISMADLLSDDGEICLLADVITTPSQSQEGGVEVMVTGGVDVELEEDDKYGCDSGDVIWFFDSR